MNKIFGIGLSRTGTTSLSDTIREATRINLIHYPNPVELWDRKSAGAVDIPVVAEFIELDFHFPHSKFVYTIRDKEEWLDSIVPYFARKKDWSQSGRQVEIRRKVYGDPFPDRYQASLAWDRHDAMVHEYFKNRPEKLFTVNIPGGDTPEALWNFLGLNPEQCPKQFTHSNKLKK